MKEHIALAVLAVAALAFAGSAQADLVSLWNFDSKTGTTIPDQVTASGHDGTLALGADITTGALGYGGSGEAFTSNADTNSATYGHMSTPNADFSGAFEVTFTWTAMVKTAGGDGGIVFWSSIDPYNKGSKGLYMVANEVEFDAGWVASRNTEFSIGDEQWHQIVVTYNPTGDAFAIYIDGTSRFSGTLNVDRWPEAASQFFNIGFLPAEVFFDGEDNPPTEFPGLIDDVAVFDTVLTGRDLTKLFQEGPKGFLPVDILPGDANDNGFIDDDDLAVLLSNWESDPGTITTWALGDFTADADVDDDDLAVLLGNWTGSPPPADAAVPEPVSAVLLLIGAPLAALRRRRR